MGGLQPFTPYYNVVYFYKYCVTLLPDYPPTTHYYEVMYPAIGGSAHPIANLLAKATLSHAILSDLAITQARSLDRESEPVRKLSQSYVSTIQFKRSYHRTPTGI